MAADEKQVSALLRRHEQVKRWEDSDTNLEPVSPKRDRVKVKFQDGCVFLAACSSGDKDEVEKLLRRGADINTANVDGLTALHQACIDDNLEMVEFLVTKGADVDVCDNEGWTPLHATASCAFTEIARYLIKHGANVAAVNNDGDLPIDIAENEDMENLLQEEMKKQGIDAEAARSEEEDRMLEDAKEWLKNKAVENVLHPKTGATSLHVAAAKGYIDVMRILLQAGAHKDAEDYDGWTPLHAAAHWGQEEACKILVDNMCDMMHKNKAGHTAFDLAEKDMLKLLEELKEKQASLRSKQEIETDTILPSGHGGKRRSSVTRMSGDQKHNVIQRTSEEERAALASLHAGNSQDKIFNSISSKDEDKSEEAETERKNEKNKQVSQQIQLPAVTTISTSTPSTWSRPTSVATAPGAELRRPDMPKIEEVAETERPTTDGPTLERPSMEETVSTPVIPTTATVTVPSMPSITSSVPTSTQASVSTDTSSSVLTPTSTVSISKNDKQSDLSNDTSVQDSVAGKPANFVKSGRDLVSRSISVPARLPTEKHRSLSQDAPPPITSSTSSSSTTSTAIENELLVPLWRQGLRKTGSSSMVHEWVTDNDSNSLPRSASSPRLVLDSRLDSLQERLNSRRPLSSIGSLVAATTTVTTTTTDTEGKSGDRNSYTFGQTYRTTYGVRSSTYVPYYKLCQQQREAEAATTARSSVNLQDSRQASSELIRLQERGCVTSAASSSSSNTTAYSTPTTTSTTTTSTSVFRRSYEPPKRDEETETQRKARAKHARQTRRSTQGVSLSDIVKAEEGVAAANEPTIRVKDVSPTNTTSAVTLIPSSRSTSTTVNKESLSAGSGEVAGTTGIPTATTTSTTSSISSTSGGSDADLKEDRSITSGYRRHILEDKNDSTVVPKNSFRRARENRDVNSSSDLTSNYVSRSQRNSGITSSDPSSSTSSSQNLLRSSSLRSSHLRNGETDLVAPKAEEDSKKDESAQDKKEDKKEPATLRARRQRRERRSTGIPDYSKEDEENGKENKPEEDKHEDNLGSSKYSSRFSSNSESDRSQRPVSYTEDCSRSTGSLDLDYKKKYEDEKSENERLRKELEETKKSLVEAKAELDKVMKHRTSERDKRTLERKLSEMEEELKLVEKLKAENKKLREENRALTRVVAKLSK